MIDVAWDPPRVHSQLARLMVRRGQFRMFRTVRRIGSTRRILATTLAGMFFVSYLLSGIFILATRAPADPARLQLWLSGGMAIYLMYHLVRCVWTDKVADLELNPAESLWLGGAPIQRSSVTVYHVGNVVIESVLKSLLLTVVLARDVFHVELLVVGLVTSFICLQIARLILQRWVSGLDRRQLAWARLFATTMAAAIILQVLTRLAAATPYGSPIHHYVAGTFRALGQTAASDMMQWISMPWWSASSLMVARQYDFATIGALGAALAVVPLGIMILIHTDAWVLASRLRTEQKRLAAGEYKTATERRAQRGTLADRFTSTGLIERWLPESMFDARAMIYRQLITTRRYRSTILFSFAVPTLLCLSPLMTGQIHQQWLYVVGGIALCTLLLAPPAMQIDFRRDLKRMMLLRSLPVRPRSMVLGQVAIPISVTLAFQWITIAVASIVTRPGWSQTILWAGMLSALAVITFAAENALFLTFPHHQHRQGIAMMVRAKLVFLGKVAVIFGGLTMLLVWIQLCRSYLAASLVTPVSVSGAIVTAWVAAFASLAMATWCWQRFDLERDVPPQ